MPNLGGWEFILVVLVIIVLFGPKRLPEASRSLGRSLRIFKAETKGLRDDDPATDREATVHETTHVASPLPSAPAVVPTPDQPQQRQP